MLGETHENQDPEQRRHDQVQMYGVGRLDVRAVFAFFLLTIFLDSGTDLDSMVVDAILSFLALADVIEILNMAASGLTTPALLENGTESGHGFVCRLLRRSTHAAEASLREAPSRDLVTDVFFARIFRS